MAAASTPTGTDIFDRTRRAQRRARRGTGAEAAPGFFDQQMADALIERIDDVTHSFEHGLLIGARNPSLIAALRPRCTNWTIFDANPALAARYSGLSGDEDRLPVDPESYDLIVWPGGLDSVNDVPGALLRCRLALKADGLLIGCVVGDGSFATTRQAMATADAPMAIARMHPQLSLQSICDLLQKTGFAMIVTDVERLTLAYRSLDDVVADIRRAALGTVLAGPVHQISRAVRARATTAFAAQGRADAAGERRTVERVNIIHFSGWAPHPSQPQPAKRGSGTASLAQALTPKSSPQ